MTITSGKTAFANRTPDARTMETRRRHTLHNIVKPFPSNPWAGDIDIYKTDTEPADTCTDIKYRKPLEHLPRSLLQLPQRIKYKNGEKKWEQKEKHTET